MFSLQGKPGCPLGVVLIWGYRMKMKRLKMRARKIQDQAAAKHHGHYSRTIVKKFGKEILSAEDQGKREMKPLDKGACLVQKSRVLPRPLGFPKEAWSGSIAITKARQKGSERLL